MTEDVKRYYSTTHYYSDVGTYLAKNPLQSKKDMDIPSALLLLAALDECPFEELCDYVATVSGKQVTKTGIPQFNSIAGGSSGMVELLISNSDYGMSYSDIGARTPEPVKNTETAHEKYGQLHASLALELDLVYFVSFRGTNHVYVSDLGYALMKFKEEEQRKLCAKLMLNIPIIAYMLKQAVSQEVSVEETIGMFLDGSTVGRRAYTVRKLLTEIRECAGIDLPLLSKIK